MNEKILALRRKIDEARATLEGLHTAAEGADRDLNETELEQWNTAEAEMKSLKARLARAEQVAADKLASATPVDETNTAAGITTHDNAEDAPFGESFSESFAAMMRAVHAACPQVGGEVDPRLRRLYSAAPSGSNEGIGSEGGFGLDEGVATEIDRLMFDSAELVNRCMQVPVGANTNTAKLRVIDETSRAAGSRFGGVRVYHAAAAATVTATNPKVRLVEMPLQKIMGLWYVTEEELEDSAYLAAIGPQAFAEEMAFQVDDDIFRGTGAGMALGILDSDCLVSVAKETGQEADSVYAENINKMFARMPARSRKSAVWLINQDVEPALDGLFIETGTGGYPAYLPPGGLSDAPYGRLKGRPVIITEHNSTIGDLGDIVLADLGWYAHIKKGGVKVAGSIHVRFIYDEMAFRFTYRCNGQPVLSSAITPAQGTNTLSPFVALAARA